MQRVIPRLALVLILALCLFSSCRKQEENPNKNLTLEVFSEMKTPSFSVNSHRIREHLSQILNADTGHLVGDRQVRSYYQNHRPLLWIDRKGVDSRADSLISFIRQLAATGQPVATFRLRQLEADLVRLRTLSIDDKDNQINWVMARLEYNLTKAFLRYVVGQKFGFVNPDKVLNHYCVKDSDSLHVEYFHLFDIPMKHPTTAFYEQAYQKIARDSVSIFLRQVEPKNLLYKQLCCWLQQGGHTVEQRKKILCNIERSRWNMNELPQQYSKYVIVNVPAFCLYAVDGDSTLTMRVVCGADETRTPLLTSSIYRMDINPRWVLPRSIAKNIVYKTNYLKQEHMTIRDRKTGKEVAYGSYEKIENGEQYIVQEGGSGNSLGRIIFRFNNNHAVYLHATPSQKTFGRTRRAASHGCIRLQHPYDFAVFLLEKKDKEVMEKISYSMTSDVLNHEELPEEARPKIDRAMLIGTIEVKPSVPLFITYYTIYPDTHGVMREYDDVYGYDAAIIDNLSPYL